MGDPWLEPGNAATAIAHPSITCRGRPGGCRGRPRWLLEELVHYAIGAAWASPYLGRSGWETPALTSFADVDYLTARLILHTPNTQKVVATA